MSVEYAILDRNTCSLRLAVRTLASHAGNRGSNPLGSATSDEGLSRKTKPFFFVRPELFPKSNVDAGSTMCSRFRVLICTASALNSLQAIFQRIHALCHGVRFMTRGCRLKGLKREYSPLNDAGNRFSREGERANLGQRLGRQMNAVMRG